MQGYCLCNFIAGVSIFRVSVPRSSLKSPYKLKPHRRKSFDPSDSVALSEVPAVFEIMSA